jgi:prepilin-type N-terminal cleavage/methylation domain-containing protein
MTALLDDTAPSAPYARRSMTRPRRMHGSTLIEVLAGVSVFAIIAAGAAAGTIATIRGNTASRDVTAAAALIHDKLEQLRALDPAANPADLTAGAHHDALNPINELAQRGGVFKRTWTVAANSPRRGLAEVKVTVTWSDPVPRTLSSATYVCLTRTCT